MFGLIDKWYAYRKCGTVYTDLESVCKPDILSFDEAKVTWLCFVPSIVSKVALIRRGLIPRTGNVFVWTITSFNLIKPDPAETISRLQSVYDDALEKMRKAIQQGNSINLLGVSLGNVLSIRLASQAETKIKSLVSVVGGGNLGLSGWDSILTGHIARQSGCMSAKEYEDRLSVFSPVNHVGGIEADKVVIRLGTHDLLIHFKHGKRLAEAFIERSKKTSMKINYRIYRGHDHSSSLLLSALENLWRLK